MIQGLRQQKVRGNHLSKRSAPRVYEMIEKFVIFSTSGLVLWESSPVDPPGAPLEHLIQSVFLDHRQSLTQFTTGPYTLHWENDSPSELTFCSISVGNAAGAPAVVSAVRKAFTAKFGADLREKIYRSTFPAYPQFTQMYKSLAGSNAAAPAPIAPTAAAPAAASASPTSPAGTTAADTKADTTSASPAPVTATAAAADATPKPKLTEEERLAKIKALNERLAAASIAGGRGNRGRGGNNTPASPAPTAKDPSASGKKPKKEATKWDDVRLSRKEALNLDLSEDRPQSLEAAAAADAERQAADAAAAIAVHGEAPATGERYWAHDGADDDKEAAAAAAAAVAEAEAEAEKGKGKGGVWGYLQGLVGSRPLTKDDLAPAAKSFTESLMHKNVAPDAAQQLVDGVVEELIGQQASTFSTLHALVRAGLEKALSRLLTPRRPVDVMAGVAAAKEEGRPFSIVMCGVNGVGKSTSLAKLACFFLSQGLKVGVAACDTFRSGAIEQLKTHCLALGIPLYDRGYGKDEASVAAEGIFAAKRQGLDVVLIDTAGRMQGNEALMKGLAKLVNTNQPDLILFVGEALVGNDGCDQLVNFNRALSANSDHAHPRLIDGVVLTKFDTIDTRVGAAISMVFATGQPILFVGTGQAYRDLKRCDAGMLIKALL